MIRGVCAHPPATPTTDGSVAVRAGISAWCSYCGWALINGVWTMPQLGKSGKKCHPDHGQYPLPTKEQYVNNGYPEEKYEQFMERELAPIPKGKP